MFIQFGYVTLFSSAYPLAGLCALLNNMIEIRGDAFKLCFVHQRPFGARVNSIGSWQSAMELMGIVGVMVNCALIGIVYTILGFGIYTSVFAKTDRYILRKILSTVKRNP